MSPTRALQSVGVAFAVFVCGCNAVPARDERPQRFYRTFAADPATVERAIADTFATLRIRVRSREYAYFRSKRYRLGRTSWRLEVRLFPDAPAGETTVETMVELHHSTALYTTAAQDILNDMLGIDPREELCELDRSFKRGFVAPEEYVERRAKLEKEIARPHEEAKARIQHERAFATSDAHGQVALFFSTLADHPQLRGRARHDEAR